MLLYFWRQLIKKFKSFIKKATTNILYYNTKITKSTKFELCGQFVKKKYVCYDLQPPLRNPFHQLLLFVRPLTLRQFCIHDIRDTIDDHWIYLVFVLFHGTQRVLV